MKPDPTLKPPESDGEVRFARALAALPAAERPALLTWLHDWRRALDSGRPPERIYWVLDITTGEWKRL